MSVHVTSPVWKYAPVGGTELLVLLSLADRADEDGVCWPSVAVTGEMARVGERQARRILGYLESIGEIFRVPMTRGPGRGKGRGRGNVYLVATGQDEATLLRILCNAERLACSPQEAQTAVGNILSRREAAKNKADMDDRVLGDKKKGGHQNPLSRKPGHLASVKPGHDNTDNPDTAMSTTYKEETSVIETSVETSGLRAQSEPLEIAQKIPLPPPGVQVLLPQGFPKMAAPMLAAIVNAKGPDWMVRWNGGVHFSPLERAKVAGVALAWHKAGRSIEDVERFKRYFPDFIGKKDDEPCKPPTTNQWIDRADDVLQWAREKEAHAAQQLANQATGQELATTHGNHARPQGFDTSGTTVTVNGRPAYGRSAMDHHNVGSALSIEGALRRREQELLDAPESP